MQRIINNKGKDVPDPGMLNDKSADHKLERNLYIFILLHIPLALICYHFEAVAVGHEIIVFLLGIWALVFRGKKDILLICTIAYIVGSEVLWRRTGAASQIAWEFGKYSVIFLLTLSIIFRAKKVTIPVMMLLYLGFLLPSIFVIWNEPMDLIRIRVIGTLAGPVGLLVCSVYFYNRILTDRQLKIILMVLLAPIVAVLIYAAYHTYLYRDLIHFGKSANKIAAGGGGANQVANTLALGALVCWLLLTSFKLRKMNFIITLVLLAGLSFQMLLTFSRGGPFTFAVAAIATIPFLIRGKSTRIKSLLIITGIIICSFYLVWPKINDITQGKAGLRFANLQTSRQDLAYAEFQIWRHNFIFGVGPGFARDDVGEYMEYEIQAHVEFTRMLAEHGLFGLFSMLILFYIAFENFTMVKGLRPKLWVAAFIVFTFAYMGQSATRQIVPGFLFGLTWARIVDTSRDEEYDNMLKDKGLRIR